LLAGERLNVVLRIQLGEFLCSAAMSMDVSRTKICLDKSILVAINMDRGEYYKKNIYMQKGEKRQYVAIIDLSRQICLMETMVSSRLRKWFHPWIGVLFLKLKHFEFPRSPSKS
jgi:hypothetical protein